MTNAKILNIFFLTVCVSVLSSFFLNDMVWRKNLLETGKFEFPYPQPYYGLIPLPDTSPVAEAGGALGADFAQVYFSALAIRHGQSPYTPKNPEFRDPFGRLPNYPPLTNWLYVPLTYFRYSRALLIHNFGTLFIFFAITAYCMRQFGILRYLWKASILYLLLYFCSPLGSSHFERGQFDFFAASSILLVLSCAFSQHQGALSSAGCGFFGSLKWSSFPFLGTFSVFAFLGIDNRRRWLFILILGVMLLSILSFLPQVYDYLPSLRFYEFARIEPGGVTFLRLMPKILAKGFQILCMVSVTAIFLLLCRKQSRTSLFESISFPFATAMAIQGMCYGTLSFEYRIVSLLGLVPPLALWTESTALSPRIKLAAALSFAVFLVLAFRVFDFLLGMDPVSMAIFYLINSVFWLVLCFYILLSDYMADMKNVVLKLFVSPSTFFREMPKAEGFVKPLMFMVLVSVVDGFILSMSSLVNFKSASDVGMAVASVILLPLGIGISGFAASAILFAVWKMMGSQESYKTAYQCFAWIWATTPIITLAGLIPYIGPAIGIAIAIYFVIISSLEVHRLSPRKVWPVFLAAGAIGVFFSISDKSISGRLVELGATYQISPARGSFGPDGGSGSVTVTADPECSWTASTNAGSWDWVGMLPPVKNGPTHHRKLDPPT